MRLEQLLDGGFALTLCITNLGLHTRDGLIKFRHTDIEQCGQPAGGVISEPVIGERAPTTAKFHPNCLLFSTSNDFDDPDFTGSFDVSSATGGTVEVSHAYHAEPVTCREMSRNLPTLTLFNLIC